MGIENRKQQRVAYRRNVLINGSIMVFGLDLSIGGLYVHTGRHFKSDSIVNVKLPLNGEFISAQALVQHSQDSIGMGLKFVKIDEDQLGKIAAFIEGSTMNSRNEGKSAVC